MTDTTDVRPDFAPGWRLEIPESRRRPIRAWLWSLAGMTLLILIVGGITRLTGSGLSIVEWQPFVGTVPPLDAAQWQDAFDRYRQFPEYQQLRRGMTLEEFKYIYFWEYLHRIGARAIGLVFLVPFLFFWIRGYFTRALARRTLVLFGLGAAQGVLGWLMVASGLVDRPSVSHYRLAAHLSLAFVIFGYAVWLARELAVTATRPALPDAARRLMSRGLAVVGGLFALQIVSGAFVAGLRAGLHHNTFPLMGGRLVPPNLLGLEPALLNFVQNPLTVQWTHRVLGTVLALAVVVVFVQVLRAKVDAASRRLNAALLGLMAAQYILGVLTLLYYVPVALGVAHQAIAMVILGVWIWWLHHVRTLGPLGVEAPSLAGPPGRADVRAAGYAPRSRERTGAVRSPRAAALPRGAVP
jgi:heme a synthase